MKKQIQVRIFKLKRLLRKHYEDRDIDIKEICYYEQLIRQMEDNVFNKHRIQFLKNYIEKREQLIPVYNAEIKQLYSFLADLMNMFDNYDPTNHDIAQVLSVSHVAYENFILEFPKAKGSLLQSAYMGAETYKEKNICCGARIARNNPLYYAALYRLHNYIKPTISLRVR